ncbi:MAG: hypothetical protein RL120_16730, partial [Gammaproteobacteria bacterium]
MRMKVLGFMAGCAGFITQGLASEWNFRQLDFHLPVESESIILADLNGDNLRDIILELDDRLRVYVQDSAGFDFDRGFLELQFDGRAIGWDISNSYNKAGN